MHKRSKHFDTKFFFIREKIDDNSIQIVYTPADQLAADLLTKALPQVKVEQHRKQLFGLNADSFYDIRKNQSGVVEEKNLVKFLELQTYMFIL